MKIGVRAILVTVGTAAVLTGVVFGQGNSGQPNNMPSCANVHTSGRRIVSNLEIVSSMCHSSPT